MTNYAEQMIIPALAPIIKANAGQLRAAAIPQYVLVLAATGAFTDEAEIKAAFNSIFRRGVFNLSAENSLKNS